MSQHGKGGRTVKATETTFAIIEGLEELDGARVTELAEHLGLAASTVHSHLSTLYEMRYVVREGDKYQIGSRFLKLGEAAKERKEAFDLIEPKVEELAEETEERCQFIVIEHGRGVYLHRETGSRAVWTDSGLGKRIYLHATAAGKSVLASLPEERVERILDQWGLPALTENTITDRAVLFEELDAIRKQGFAVNKEESTVGLRAVGVPITDSSGRMVGALSVSGPTHRMKGEWFEREIPNLLLGTANELELNLKYS
ncbi:IclR family transcriptional regulator [Haladaptatus salinisoli]|uniref:IclR family transcriptional regulator n=1 Tax=Haladaptatus salinisoli TaxID=2884876 RepID=UPI001D09CF0D|nr:IclR family transcriptional regulator [Haladaptatus salinisoli]